MNVPALRDRPCPACGGHDATPEIASRQPADEQTLDALEPYWFGIDKQRQFFTYHRCHGCGLLYNRSFFGDAQLARLYGAMPPNMDLVPDSAIAATQRGYFRAASRRVAVDGDYLEIGPDVGHIVADAAREGQFGRFWLFEPNTEVHARLHRAAAGNATTILTNMSDLSAVPDASVGLAVMVHVLDHLLDPLEMLRAIRRKLRAGGALMIVTHDERSMLRRLLRGRWPAFCLQHPELYNPATIASLLERARFDGIEVTRSTNQFPADFLIRQAAQALGMRLGRLPLPKHALRLRLGNMLTFAWAPATQSAAVPWSPAERAA
jgi:SAM-dependent methyltransferase